MKQWEPREKEVAVDMLRVHIGLVLRRQFRKHLEERKFLGAGIDWYENKGFLSSVFVIRGKPGSLEPTRAMLLKAGITERVM